MPAIFKVYSCGSIFVVLMCWRGDAFTNDYGEDPLKGQ